VWYLLVVYYEECDFKMFVFCIISSYNCFSADMKYYSHAEWRFLMLYFYEYKIRGSQKILWKKLDSGFKHRSIFHKLRGLYSKIEIRTVKIQE